MRSFHGINTATSDISVGGIKEAIKDVISKLDACYSGENGPKWVSDFVKEAGFKSNLDYDLAQTKDMTPEDAVNYIKDCWEGYSQGYYNDIATIIIRDNEDSPRALVIAVVY